MTTPTLFRIGSELSSPKRQREILGDPQWVASGRFEAALRAHGWDRLQPAQPRILQVNLGKVCNQTCAHCHVDAGPDRRENMSRETAQSVIAFLKANPCLETLDITGGAPEMNGNFRELVIAARDLGRCVIDRCNLTILLATGFTDLPEFLAHHRVQIVASLPCYLESNCDSQRGEGVFEKSIRAIRRLNELGYGRPDSGLELNLVYNPVGTGLPPPQERLEADYHRELQARYGLVFNRLFAITNMPISRFLDDLLRQGKLAEYMNRLISSFNPSTVDKLMCRDTLSVDWRGFLYDCDFNQMLDLPVEGDSIHISTCDLATLSRRSIRVANHCFGCTAGCGSSCQGSVVGLQTKN